jgi:ABC-2 type transport system permease protein
MIPLDMMPDFAQRIARLLPASHAVNAFNGLVMGKVASFSAWGSIIVLLSSALIAFGLALFLFSWDSHNKTRRGHPLLALLVLLPYVLSVLLL